MNTTRAILLLATALAAAPCAADEALRREALQLFGTIEAGTPVHSAEVVALGRALFWDTRVSGDGKTACASCHATDAAGADSRRVPIDARGKPMPRNAPTVFNSMRQAAPFDRFLAGDERALSAKQQAGLRRFIAEGCAGCHNGPLLGGNSVQKFGLARDYWTETGSKTIDPGLYAVTKKEEDRYRFRVPMLRNVAQTAPYFHDGSVDRLERAVQVMAATQLGQTMDDATANEIAAFLESLTGERPSNFSAP